jgi:hypothetical protein
MTPLKWLRRLSLVSAVLLVPVASVAEVESCAGYRPTLPANYSGEASALLQSVRDDAQQIADRITELNELSADPDVNWGIHAQELASIRMSISEMETRVCRLDVIQPVVPGGEGHVIQSLPSEVQQMAADARLAFDYVTHRQGELWSQQYTAYTRNIYNAATATAGQIDQAEQISQLRALDSRITLDPGLAGK